MSVSTPSQGTHFSDGVRVGPILGSSYTAGVNVLTPSVMVSSPVDQLPPGVFTTPNSLLDLIPAPVNASAIAAAQTPAGAAYLTLVTTNSINATVITYNGVQNVLKLDCARNVTITGAVNVAASTFLIFGWDEYGVPLTEQITGPVGNTFAVGNKAFKYIQSVHTSAGTVANITVGVGNAIGLPYFISDAGYPGVAQWNSEPFTDVYTVTLGSNPIATVSGSSIVTLSLANANPAFTAASYVVGQTLQLSVGIPTVGGVSFNTLNEKVEVAALNYTNNTLSIDARIVATSTVTAGGGVGITIQTNDKSVIGDQRVATATTRDVRGTYTPPTLSQGVARLTLNFYNASADTRNYNAASGGVVYLNNNPLLTRNGTSLVTVFAFNHQLTEGENVTIAGATAVGGIGAASLNITAPVTILGPDIFTYTATANATSNAFGGGTGVNITPGIGNLYESTVGRFGVAQYNLTPRP